jgi:hypothetical protein
MLLGGQAALAQGSPSACVTALSSEYGSTPALQSTCASDTDCTFQAAEGNASALALIGAIVKKTEACFTAAGMSIVKEATTTEGTTRQYGMQGGKEICALLIATGPGDLASGMRATCQPAP